jgi:hypothetical protein
VPTRHEGSNLVGDVKESLINMPDASPLAYPSAGALR